MILNALGVAAIVIILAVAEETSWWDTPTGQNVGDVLRWLIAIGVIAAAWKGIRYITTEVFGFKLWFGGVRRESKRRDVLLDEMLAPDGWPVVKQDVHELKEDVSQLKEGQATAMDKLDDIADKIDQAITDTPPPPSRIKE